MSSSRGSNGQSTEKFIRLHDALVSTVSDCIINSSEIKIVIEIEAFGDIKILSEQLHISDIFQFI